MQPKESLIRFLFFYVECQPVQFEFKHAFGILDRVN